MTYMRCTHNVVFVLVAIYAYCGARASAGTYLDEQIIQKKGTIGE